MRIVLVIAFALALAACGKKKSPQAPSSGESTDSRLQQDADEKDSATPDDADEAPTTRSSDPQEGGE